MTDKAGFALRGGNPDVLTCIANLSNDEVFTPPELAARMLDALANAWAAANGGEDIWTNPDVTFLDPFTKSGVFLREITARLTDGLADAIPDLQERVEHILTTQVYGIGITRLTSLLARRSVYCSRSAISEHSIAETFESEAGNIWFERLEHTWADGKCKFCGANKATLDRGPEQEAHAYAFIHTDDISAHLTKLFGDDMQFDVIIGNPPYQLGDGGAGASAIPIYQRFVETAKQLDPRLLAMIIPSRWFAGGRGLDTFRQDMLKDDRIRVLVDYLDSRDVFPSVDVAGGVCYFLWDRENRGPCRVVSNGKVGAVSEVSRPLLEKGADVFIRYNEGIATLRKVITVEGGDASALMLPEAKRFSSRVSSQKPFGLRTYYRGTEAKTRKDDLLLLQSGGRAWVKRSEVTDGADMIDRWKVFTSKSSSEHAGQSDRDGRRRVLSRSGVIPPGSAVTETYVILEDFDNEEAAKNCLSYVCTKFFRFLIVLRSSGQDISRVGYSFIPVQDYSTPWTDEALSEKYGLDGHETEFIDSLIRPMEPDDGANS